MKNKLTNRINSRRQRRGFTLTEIAIVLGIIGLILGAIWAAASAVYSNLKVSQAQQGITFTAQQVRSMFAGSNQTGIAAGTSTDITAPGMFPVSWAGTATGVVGNPWNQNPAASASFVYGNGSSFAIELDNISADGCVALLGFYNFPATTAQGGQIAGLAGSAYGTANIHTVSVAVPSSATFALPSVCTGTGNTNDVAISFNMSTM